MKFYKDDQPSDMAGLITLSMRLVIGWTYFSAFWRRVVLEDKLIPEEAGYIGEKFNHFLPNALGIKPIIEYLVTHPEDLHLAMVVFTMVEAVVGLFLILGLFTRLSSIGVLGLAMGILLGSGWLGTTCLDEWQIGVLGVAGGFTLFLSGSGPGSLDHYFMKKGLPFTRTTWFCWLGSGTLPLKKFKVPVFIASALILFLTLFTNQIFHGGVWGTLHNKSVKPKVEISDASLEKGSLHFRIYRTEGADVYGSFLIEIQLLNKAGEVVMKKNAAQLSSISAGEIRNHYVTKVKPGKHSLIIPLGAKADISIGLAGLPVSMDEDYTLKLVDISGIEWVASVK